MQEIGERGTITKINRGQQRGTIRGEDGRERHFDREGKIYWLQFDELKPGDPVRYDVESGGSAINVERIDSGRRR
jgi:cold shock CspA family protein